MRRHFLNELLEEVEISEHQGQRCAEMVIDRGDKAVTQLFLMRLTSVFGGDVLDTRDRPADVAAWAADRRGVEAKVTPLPVGVLRGKDQVAHHLASSGTRGRTLACNKLAVTVLVEEGHD